MASEQKSISTRAKLALVLVPPLLIFGGIELATRAYLTWGFGDRDPRVTWQFEYEPYVVVKRKGKLDRSFPVADGQYRVLLIGGSTAAQMPDDVLARAFSAYTERDVVVMNLGEGGYILNQERVMMILRGVTLAPDLVISLDGANDFVVVSKLSKPGITFQAESVAMAVDRPILNGFLAVLRKSNFVVSLAKLQERRSEIAFQGETALQAQTIDHLIEGWTTIATVAKGLETPYLMVLQPYLYLRETLTEGERKLGQAHAYRKDYMSEMFQRTSKRAIATEFPGETRFVDGTVLFDEVEDVEIFVDGVHMTPEGNEILAARIASTAAEQGFVPER